MSVLFRKALEQHRQQLREKLTDANGASHEKELKDAKSFLNATKDVKFRKQIQKRIDQLEKQAKGETDATGLKATAMMLDQLWEHIKGKPEYFRTRKSRKSSKA